MPTIINQGVPDCKCGTSIHCRVIAGIMEYCCPKCLFDIFYKDEALQSERALRIGSETAANQKAEDLANFEREMALLVA